MRGTTSDRPRSPRRCLRADTPLCPAVPTDLRAAHAEAVDEQYGWPELDDPTVEDDIWAYAMLEDFEDFEDPDHGLDRDAGWYDDDGAYDWHADYRARWDLELDDFDFDFDFDAWDDRAFEEDLAWAKHNHPAAHAPPFEAHASLPPQWDPAHPLYGMHPRPAA